MKNNVEISIIMGVYNEPIRYIRESIESILHQTFLNFELIIIMDNPDNEKLIPVLKEYEKLDNRIVLKINEKNLQLAGSLNRALSIAKGIYIARMDADDISLFDRLEKQYLFLKENENIDLVGSNVFKIDKNSEIIGNMKNFNDPTVLKKIIPYRTIAFHPTWMFKRTILDKVIGYRDFPVGQDYDFLYRVVDFGYNISNINENLLKYRINSKSISHKKALFQNKIRRYIQQLHKERINKGKDSFDKSELLRFNNSFGLESRLHIFSHKLFQKAIKNKDDKNYLKFFFYLLVSLIFSRFTFLNFVDELSAKFIIYKFKKNR